MISFINSTFVPLFTELANGRRRRNLGGFNGKAGIYVIRENDKIIYVGMSQSCIVKALYRHFYYWKSDPTRRTSFPRTTYIHTMGFHNYDACVLLTTAEDAPKIERGLILSIQPRDNRERYQYYLDDLIRKSEVPEPQAAPPPSSSTWDDNFEMPF